MGIPSNWMFKNRCAGCGKKILTPAVDRSGNVGLVFCGGVCETLYKNKKRFDHEKNVVPFHKSITKEKIAERLSKKKWGGYQYNSKPEPVF